MARWLAALSCALLLAHSGATVPLKYRGKLAATRPSGIAEKVIALTFDDGPNPAVTPRILDILSKHRVKATFFVLGKCAKAFPKLVLAEHAQGHEIGNHSYSHAAKLTKALASVEISRTGRVVKSLIGSTPTLFRPPYGLTKSSLSNAAKQAGYTSVTWTVSGADTAAKKAKDIVYNLTAAPKPGDIALMHDGQGHELTAEALPAIIDGLKKKGYRFVTVSEMLAIWGATPTPAKGKSRAK
jgi:peptidoglycan/xylan/chitin deacetylase (PgdA/CDA1 family)